MLPIAGRTAGPIKTKLGIGTYVDSRIVFSQGQGQGHLQRLAGPRQLRPEDGYLQLVCDKVMKFGGLNFSGPPDRRRPVFSIAVIHVDGNQATAAAAAAVAV